MARKKAGEQWYAIVDGKGNLVSTGSVIATDDELKEQGFTKVALPREPDFGVEQWDGAAEKFVPLPPPDPTPEPVAALREAQQALERALAAHDA